MKVLLLEDVYKLGRAGDVKKVAPGYARNYLMPQGLAVLATPGAVKQAGRIQKQGEVKRIVYSQLAVEFFPQQIGPTDRRILHTLLEINSRLSGVGPGDSPAIIGHPIVQYLRCKVFGVGNIVPIDFLKEALTDSGISLGGIRHNKVKGRFAGR